LKKTGLSGFSVSVKTGLETLPTILRQFVSAIYSLPSGKV